MNRPRLLGAAEERELALRIRDHNDPVARKAFILANIGLVHRVARKFTAYAHYYDDLVQEGMLGLMRAISDFDPDRGAKFSSYGTHWIRAKISRHIQHLRRDDTPRMAGVSLALTGTGRRERPRSMTVSLQTPIGNEGTDCIEDVVASDTVEPADEMSQRAQHRDVLLKVLDEIYAEMDDERVKVLVNYRLLADEPETLQKIGDRTSLSREGVRLMENKVLAKVRGRLSPDLAATFGA